MHTAVHLRSCVALLGGFPALAGIDLDIARAEIVLLQGSNGAGKTTVLRTCAGLLPIASGQAVVLGCDLTVDRLRLRRRVGMLGHSTFLYDDMSVTDNVRFWARAARVPAQDAKGALDRLGVSQRLLEQPVSRLSAGQRRRVSFAAMLARRPELWLLDEPHAGLDQQGRDLVDGLMQEAAGAGATVIFASHESERATGIACRTVTVAGGTVLSREVCGVA